MSRLNCNFKRVVILLVLSVSSNTFIFGTRNVSRYFPFLERLSSEYILDEKSHVSPALFFAKASGAFKRGGGDTGIPELWGFYDLNDIISSLEKTNATFVNPIKTERGPEDNWINKSIRYKVDGKLKGKGLLIPYEQYLKYGLSFGAFLPVMHVNASDHFTFLSGDSDSALSNLKDGEIEQLDRIRRNVNEDLGINGGDWSKTGIGDLDLHAKLDLNWDYTLLMRSINLVFQLGVLCPTGTKSDYNYASSVSFMGDGHWGVYFDAMSELELKRDWIFGVLFGFVHQFNNTRKIRIPVYNEPAIFSALIRDTKIDPGMTFKFSPYIIAKNISDGFNFQFRYTYLRHNKDKWYDNNTDSTVKSYLHIEPGYSFSGTDLTAEDISKNINEKANLTKWSDHYLSFQISYDALEADNKWFMDPVFYALLDYQVNGNGSCKTHQVSLGIELHF